MLLWYQSPTAEHKIPPQYTLCMPLSLDDLESHLFKCADIIWDAVDPTAYKKRILQFDYYNSVLWLWLLSAQQSPLQNVLCKQATSTKSEILTVPLLGTYWQPPLLPNHYYPWSQPYPSKKSGQHTQKPSSDKSGPETAPVHTQSTPNLTRSLTHSNSNHSQEQ